jgi:hypothetical protein
MREFSTLVLWFPLKIQKDQDHQQQQSHMQCEIGNEEEVP